MGRDDETRLRMESSAQTRAFDGDAESWRLAAEALRIRYAALFDPMLAIATSDLQALPHQIKGGVRRTTASDPAALSACRRCRGWEDDHVWLYVKELMLRRLGSLPDRGAWVLGGTATESIVARGSDKIVVIG